MEYKHAHDTASLEGLSLSRNTEKLTNMRLPYPQVMFISVLFQGGTEQNSLCSPIHTRVKLHTYSTERNSLQLCTNTEWYFLLALII